MSVQCCICLSEGDGDGLTFSCLPCGHVFHTTCIEQSIEFKSECPQCRVRIKKRPPPLTRLFITAGEDDSDVAAAVALGGTNDGGAQTDNAELQLKMQLLQCSKRIQDLLASNAELEKSRDTLKRQLQDTTARLNQREHRYQSLVGELTQANQKNKALNNEHNSLKLKIQSDEVRFQRLEVALNTNLRGDDLVMKLAAMAGTASHAEFMHAILERRNRETSDAVNRAERAERERITAEADLKEKLQKANATVMELQERLDAAKSNGGQMYRQGNSSAMNRPAGSKPREPGPLLKRKRQQEMLRQEVADKLPPVGGAPLARAPFTSSEPVSLLDDTTKEPWHVLEEGIEDQGEVELDPEDDDYIGDADGDMYSDCAFEMPETFNKAHVQQQQQPQQLSVKAFSSLVNAGPSRLAMGAAPGRSFIKKETLANLGTDQGAKFVQKGPDGRGGVVTVYRPAAGGKSHVVSGASKSKQQQQRAAPAGKKAKATAVNDSLRISHFFEKTS